MRNITLSFLFGLAAIAGAYWGLSFPANHPLGNDVLWGLYILLMLCLQTVFLVKGVKIRAQLKDDFPGVIWADMMLVISILMLVVWIGLIVLGVMFASSFSGQWLG